MDKARSSLMNLDYGIFPRACDHERTAEIGWLLYSTRQQDEERLSELLSSLVQEQLGQNGAQFAQMTETAKIIQT